MLWLVFLYTLFTDKPENYYEETKKYTFEENYVTDGNSIPALNEVSNLQMDHRNDGKERVMEVEDFHGDNNLDEIQTLPPNVLKIISKRNNKVKD
jgi:hypothetical protein